MTVWTERILFRLILTPCCGHLLCWVNPRLPSYCPECGKRVISTIRDAVTFRDEEAYLKIHGELHELFK